METAGLSKKLEVSNIDFKVKQLIKSGPKVMALLLAYKDARVDMNILDEVVGPENWQNDYKRDSKGVLQCGIAIKFGSEWVWKWSNGTESMTEKKRANILMLLKELVLCGVLIDIYTIFQIYL